MINSILLSVILQQQNSYREYLAGDGIDPYSYVEFDSDAVSEVKDLTLPGAKNYIKVIFQSEDTNRRLIQLCLLGKFTTRSGTSVEQEIIESFHAKYLKGDYPGDIYKSIPTDDLLTLYYLRALRSHSSVNQRKIQNKASEDLKSYFYFEELHSRALKSDAQKVVMMCAELLFLRDLDKAQKIARICSNIPDPSVQVLAGLIFCYDINKQHANAKAAEEIWLNALKKYPNNGRVHDILSFHYEYRDPKRALIHAKLALSLPGPKSWEEESIKARIKRINDKIKP